MTSMTGSAQKVTRRRSLIVAGQDAVVGRYPYFVTLDRYCAGALIAADIVLTAGHCKPTSLAQQVHVGTYYMDAAVDAKADGDENHHETFTILDMERHPLWIRRGDDEFVYDFTLLKLNGLSSRRPVRINRRASIPAARQTVTAMGLGDLTADADVRPTVLQQVELQYWPTQECRLAHNDNDQEESFANPPDRIGPTHLCTFVPPHNDRDACNYDSGGPISVTNSNNSADDDLLVALVSWGIGCADPIFPGVNARVSAVSDWIDDYVCTTSAQPPADFPCWASSSSSPSNFDHIVHWWWALLLSCTGGALLVCLVLKKCCRQSSCKHFGTTKPCLRGEKHYYYHSPIGNDDQDDDVAEKDLTMGMKRHNTGVTTDGSSDDDDEEDSRSAIVATHSVSYQAMHVQK